LVLAMKKTAQPACTRRWQKYAARAKIISLFTNGAKQRPWLIYGKDAQI